MHPSRPAVVVLFCVLVAFGCFDPSDRRPGTKLSGEIAAYPSDWSFTEAEKEIAVEVTGFLGLPHSVTIWCATLDGELYIGARDPDSKRWPAWADANPNVRLKIADSLYDVRLTPVADADTIARLQPVYAQKYAIPAPEPGGPPPPPTRYWRVGPR
jgi:hypothetical protein